MSNVQSSSSSAGSLSRVIMFFFEYTSFVFFCANRLHPFTAHTSGRRMAKAIDIQRRIDSGMSVSHAERDFKQLVDDEKAADSVATESLWTLASLAYPWYFIKARSYGLRAENLSRSIQRMDGQHGQAVLLPTSHRTHVTTSMPTLAITTTRLSQDTSAIRLTFDLDITLRDFLSAGTVPSTTEPTLDVIVQAGSSDHAPAPTPDSHLEPEVDESSGTQHTRR